MEYLDDIPASSYHGKSGSERKTVDDRPESVSESYSTPSEIMSKVDNQVKIFYFTILEYFLIFFKRKTCRIPRCDKQLLPKVSQAPKENNGVS